MISNLKSTGFFLVGGGRGELGIFSPGGGPTPNSCVKNAGDKD